MASEPSIIQRLFLSLCSGENYVSHEAAVVDAGTSIVGVKSIIKPSRWQPKAVGIEEDGINRKKQEEVSKDRKTELLELVPCFARRRLVTFADDEGYDFSYDEVESYCSDDSTKMLSFVSDSHDSFLGNLVTDYLKNRLLHLHSTNISPIHAELVESRTNDDPEIFMEKPSALAQTVVLSRESKDTLLAAKMFTFLSDDESTCDLSAASTMSFDSREKYSFSAKSPSDCIFESSSPSPDRYALSTNSVTSLYPDEIEKARENDFFIAQTEKIIGSGLYITPSTLINHSSHPQSSSTTDSFISAENHASHNRISINLDEKFKVVLPNQFPNVFCDLSDEARIIDSFSDSLLQSTSASFDLKLHDGNLDGGTEDFCQVQQKVVGDIWDQSNLAENKEGKRISSQNGMLSSVYSVTDSLGGKLGDGMMGEETRKILQKLAEVKSSLDSSDLLRPIHRLEQWKRT